MTSYRIPYLADDDQLQALVRRLIDGGWFGKGYFYVVDEPANKAAYDAVHRRQRSAAAGSSRATASSLPSGATPISTPS